MRFWGSVCKLVLTAEFSFLFLPFSVDCTLPLLLQAVVEEN